MTQPRRRALRRRPATVLAAAAAALSVILPAVPAAAAVPAHAVRQARASARPAAVAARSGHGPAAVRLTPAREQRKAADLAAAAAAARAGKPVVVAADTTEVSQTIARPDGSFVTTISALPVRVRQHGKWRPVSARLRKLSSGRLAPVATPVGVSLSGGGAGPLAVLSYSGGGTLTLGAPRPLPAPVVSGPTATYRAGSGQDLAVTVTSLGGITITLTTAGDAGGLTLPVTASAMRLHARAGVLLAAAPGGQTEYTASVQASVPGAGRDGRPTAIAAPAALTGSRILLTPQAADSAIGVGHSFAASSVTSVTATIVPSIVSSCTTKDQYDCINDSPTSSTIGYTEVRQPGSCQIPALWNTAQGGGEGIGLEDYGDDKYNGTYCGNNLIYRTYYVFDTSSLYQGMQVQKATLYVTEQTGSDQSLTNTWPVSWYTESANVGGNTVWSNQPAGTLAGTRNLESAYGSNGPQQADFDATTVIATHLSSDVLTLGMRGDETGSFNGTCKPGISTENCGFMRLTTNPFFQVIYDVTPNPPAFPAAVTSPATHLAGTTSDSGCVGSASSAPWLGAQDIPGNVGLSVTIQARLSPSEPVRALYTLSDLTDPSLSQHAGPSNWYTGTQTTDSPIAWPASGIGDGHTYEWTSQTEVNGIAGSDGTNGPYDSNPAGPCYFRVDATDPVMNSVTSTTCPPTGSAKAPASCTFTFAATDPKPADNCGTSGCQASGVYGYYYSLNTPVPANGGILTTSATTPSIQVTSWGENTLYVQAQDYAGNRSQPIAYTFYVPWNPNQPTVPGDVNGDGTPDLLGTTSGGGLNLYDNPATTLSAAANFPSTSPDGTSDWNTWDITHRGSLIQNNGYDDLWALQAASGTLDIYRNGGTTYDSGKTGTSPIYWKGGPAGDTSWSAATQILSPGDAWTGAPACGSTPCDNTMPTLLVVFSDGSLWAYQSVTGGQLQNPVELGTGWGNTTLVAPGTVNGHVTIWARDKGSGSLYDYPINLDSAGNPTLAAPGSAPGTLTAFGGTLPGGSGAFLITINRPGGTAGIPGGTYPVLASPGDDTTGAGPVLYMIDTSGNEYEYTATSGQTTPGTTGPVVNPISQNPASIGTVPAGTTISQLS